MNSRKEKRLLMDGCSFAFSLCMVLPFFFIKKLGGGC